MLINTFLDTEDFVHLYYPEDEGAAGAQGCAANARLASKYPPRPPSPCVDYNQAAAAEMTERQRYRAPPPPEPPPPRARAADLFPRLRTHYDEPGLDAGFTPICAEFVQWVGRTADGGTIAMSNYRLHLQGRRRGGCAPAAVSVPLRLIDALEIRDLLCLLILCKHGRQLKCTFSTGEQCGEWARRLGAALAPLGSVHDTFAAAYAAWAREQPRHSAHRALLRASHAPRRHWFGPEVERLGFTAGGAWRVSAANAEHKLCASYPPLLVVPAAVCDEDLDSVARFRAMRRIPTAVWRHGGSGGVLARSSQPEVGWLGWRSAEDERLLAAFVAATNADRAARHLNNKVKLLIVDARSYASAVTNRARGGGVECAQYYPHAEIQFMCLPNIHNVRRAFHQLRALLADGEQANWLGGLERTLWLQYAAGVLRAAGVAARAAAAGRPVLVHCSDGWDRTPQIVAAAQLLLDPHYRTLDGFRVLVEREWLDFGHKFADRCGHQFGPEDPNERSPIFLQWLDVVYQMTLQYPCSFEFNEAYLIKLATHAHSCMFGTFLCNSMRARAESRAGEAAGVWPLLRAPAYRNHLYAPPAPHAHMIWPDPGVRAMQLWTAMYCGERAPDGAPPPPPPLPPLPPLHNGVMSKTRSCDNLASEGEGERRSAPRRCSDPSLQPDLIKLSLVVNGGTGSTGSSGSAGSAGGGLTDSCVDELPAPAPPTPPPAPPLAPPALSVDVAGDDVVDDVVDGDQVDGLHPEHFESGAPASTSSSLERELAAPPAVLAAAAPAAPRAPHAASPDEPAVFLGDAYTDVLGMADAAREAGRTRNISITWRSVSESSNQSSAGEGSAAAGEGGEGAGELTNHNRNHAAGALPRLDDIAAKFLEVDLNGGASSSGASSESEEDGEGDPEGARRGASQLTLCPASPRRPPPACCACRPPCPPCPASAGDGATWGAGGGAGGGVRCVCGAGARVAPDSPDGLPPVADPLQARLHEIILYQKKVVEELSGQLREAREALRRAASPPAPPAAAPPPAVPASPHPAQPAGSSGAASGSGSRSGSGSGSRSGSGSASGSGSGSEVEVGEEARGVVWLPDSAAPRCQHCRNHFWLARRRHHCRRCGGIFCGSCSELSAWGAGSGAAGAWGAWGARGAVRVCRRCRAQR